MQNDLSYGPTVLRFGIGLLFFISGIMMILNPDVILLFLRNIGFSQPYFFGWIIMLSEVIFGFALIIGFLVRWCVWPLFLILFFAGIFIAVPAAKNILGIFNLLLYIAVLFGLLSLFISGAGKMALNK
jgi:uncharacterized membrane protein YphA (DoxX/SURF4 family)